MEKKTISKHNVVIELAKSNRYYTYAEIGRLVGYSREMVRLILKKNKIRLPERNPLKECLGCGMFFKPRYRKQKYHNWDCLKENRKLRPRVVKECLVCGKKRELPAYVIRPCSPHNTCSKKCQYALRRMKSRERRGGKAD